MESRKIVGFRREKGFILADVHYGQESILDLVRFTDNGRAYVYLKTPRGRGFRNYLTEEELKRYTDFANESGTTPDKPVINKLLW